MNRSGLNLITIDLSPRWFFLPPFVAIFTMIAARFFATNVPIPVDPAIWGLSGLTFTLLTVLYGIFIKRRFFRGLFPVQLSAQGVLLCPLSLRFGSIGIAWVGVLLAICGAVVLVALYCYRSRFDVFAPQIKIAREIDNLPLPFAVTDGEGNILSASNLLLRLAQKNRAMLNGEKIDALLPLSQEIVSMGGKEWRILQTSMDDGTYFFQLEELREVSAPAPVPQAAVSAENFTDPVTSLCGWTYATKRIEEELYRIYRYKRWMSAALLRVVFPADGSGSNPQKEDEIFNSFCRYISSCTREIDIACQTAPREILIAMPETEIEGARDVVSKLLDYIAQQRTQENQESGGSIKTLESTMFFNAPSGILDFDRLMEKMTENIDPGHDS